MTANPYSYFGRLREEDPVHWNSRYEAWVVTGYDDITYIMRHPELLSSAFWKKDPRGAFPPIRPEHEDHYHFVTDVISNWVIQLDPPDHTRVRKAIYAYFTPNTAKRWLPMVKEVINQLLAEIEGGSRIDAMHDFATPLPVLVISRFMGIPEPDRATVQKLARSISLVARTEEDRMKALAQGIKDLVNDMEREIRKREKNPTDDLLSIMVRVQQEGLYSRKEVVATEAIRHRRANPPYLGL